MENLIRPIFISIIMPQNFIYFREKTGLKCVLVYFDSLSGHFGTFFLENADGIVLQTINIIIL